MPLALKPTQPAACGWSAVIDCPHLTWLKVRRRDGARLKASSNGSKDRHVPEHPRPLDGSETSRRGLTEAIGLATALKARLRLLHVTSDFPIMLEMANTIDFEKYRSGLHQFGRNLLEETKAEAERAGLTVSTELLDVKGAVSPTRSSTTPVPPDAT
jgi:hypothetical protein